MAFPLRVAVVGSMLKYLQHPRILIVGSIFFLVVLAVILF